MNTVFQRKIKQRNKSKQEKMLFWLVVAEIVGTESTASVEFGFEENWSETVASVVGKISSWNDLFSVPLCSLDHVAEKVWNLLMLKIIYLWVYPPKTKNAFWTEIIEPDRKVWKLKGIMIKNWVTFDNSPTSFHSSFWKKKTVFKYFEPS